MNRDEFCAKLAPLDAEQRSKVLWNVYWRGTAGVRERIEGELDPRERERRKAAVAPPDPDLVLMEVRDFVELAESGAYIAGLDRIAAADAPSAVKKSTRAWRDWERSSWSLDSAERDRQAGSLAGIRCCLSISTGTGAAAGRPRVIRRPGGGFLKARRLPWDVCRAARPLACSTMKYGSTASTSSPRPCACSNVANRAGRRPSCLTRRSRPTTRHIRTAPTDALLMSASLLRTVLSARQGVAAIGRNVSAETIATGRLSSRRHERCCAARQSG